MYQLVRSVLGRNPLSGEVFLFLCKSRGMIKILHWQKDGFILYTKKWEEGTFEVPPDGLINYKILESGAYTNVIRIARFQHCKRQFLNIEGD